MSFARTKSFCLFFIISKVSEKVFVEISSSFILNEETYKKANPVKYRDRANSRNNFESFIFDLKIENKKLNDGKKMQFINR
jgi:hypothetical protein